MPNVQNKKTISCLAIKSFLANKTRNIVAILAIVLTTVMLISIFAIGNTILKLSQQSTFRMVGSSSHGSFKYLTEEQYDKLKSHKDIKDISFSIPIAFAENKELSKLAGEIRYSEDKNAKWGFSYPTIGTMPIEYKDIATNTLVLEALKVPLEIGQKVTLEFKINNKVYKETFNLSGYWEGDPVMNAQQIFLSKEFVNELSPVTKVPYLEQEIPSLFGTINADVWLSNSINIEKKLNKILIESGFNSDEILTGVNWGYTDSEIDIGSIISIVIILIVIIFSGYIIINNIFYISITKDIQFYGLLKAIGTTSKQIKTMIRKEAFYLCGLAVPIGLLIGTFISNIIIPFIIDTLTFKGERIESSNIWVFVLTGLFSIFTVIISCMSPAKFASKISPIEALRIADVSINSKKKKSRTNKISILILAYKNVFRNKKKFISVIISLSLSIILMLGMYTAVNSFNLDIYLKESAVSDFIISNPVLSKRYQLSYVNDETPSFVSELDSVTNYGAIYMTESMHELSSVGKKNYNNILEEFKNEINIYEGNQNEEVIPSHIYGVDLNLLNKLNFYENDGDFERFSKGDFVYLTPFYEKDNIPKNYHYSIGDIVSIEFEDGFTKDYTVLGFAKIPYPISSKHSHLINPDFILPSDELLAHTQNKNAIHIILDGEAEEIETIENKIATYCDKSGMDYTSKANLKEEFKGFQNMYTIVGGALSLILALIGTLNFVNSMITSVTIRKIEIATLQSIGMTNKQVKNMLISEGVLHFLIVMIVTMTIGQLISYAFTQFIAGQVWFFKYNFSPLPLLFCFPILLIIVTIAPILLYKNISSLSLIDRLRAI